jgi:hypothetical protein
MRRRAWSLLVQQPRSRRLLQRTCQKKILGRFSALSVQSLSATVGDFAPEKALSGRHRSCRDPVFRELRPRERTALPFGATASDVGVAVTSPSFLPSGDGQIQLTLFRLERNKNQAVDVETAVPPAGGRLLRSAASSRFAAAAASISLLISAPSRSTHPRIHVVHRGIPAV